jgi:hypothetical protein
MLMVVLIVGRPRPALHTQIVIINPATAKVAHRCSSLSGGAANSGDGRTRMEGSVTTPSRIRRRAGLRSEERSVYRPQILRRNLCLQWALRLGRTDGGFPRPITKLRQRVHRFLRRSTTFGEGLVTIRPCPATSGKKLAGPPRSTALRSSAMVLTEFSKPTGRPPWLVRRTPTHFVHILLQTFRQSVGIAMRDKQPTVCAVTRGSRSPRSATTFASVR